MKRDRIRSACEKALRGWLGFRKRAATDGDLGPERLYLDGSQEEGRRRGRAGTKARLGWGGGCSHTESLGLLDF